MEIEPCGVVIHVSETSLQRKAVRDLTQWISVGRPGAQRRIPVTLYSKSPDGRITVPSAWFRSQRYPHRDKIPPKKITISFRGALRDDQERAVSTIHTRLLEDGSATMVMRTGGGKTVCALALAHRLGVKTLILVHKTFLMNQWVDRLAQFIPDATVTTIAGSSRDASGDIVLGMFQTFSSASLDIDGDIGLVIVDEAHHVAAETFKNVLLRGSQKYTLGLSATPHRSDGLNITYLTGDTVNVESQSSSMTVDTSKITVEVRKYMHDSYLSVPPTTKTGDINYSAMVSAIASLHERTEFICSLLETIHVPTLILTHRRQHVTDILEILAHKQIDAKPFVPGVKDVPTSRVVVSTYQYASEGFDRRDLMCLVMTTPLKSTTQAIGRVCRDMHNENHKPLIIDIQDQWSVFIAGGAKRRREYASRGYTVMVRSQKPREETSRGSLFVDDEDS